MRQGQRAERGPSGVGGRELSHRGVPAGPPAALGSWLLVAPAPLFSHRPPSIDSESIDSKL
eukprot:scaffold203996_cov31-Tisochrysis_lutea.AAC.1